MAMSVLSIIIIIIIIISSSSSSSNMYDKAWHLINSEREMPNGSFWVRQH
jgi:hypothetical protein